MDLLIMRHGRAAERGPAYPDDRLRPLTDEGGDRVIAIAEYGAFAEVERGLEGVEHECGQEGRDQVHAEPESG